MNRQERVDVTALTIALAIILLLVGMLLAPQSAATAAPVDESPVSVTVDSENEPSTVAGLTVGELLRDAWTSYQVIPVEAPSGQFTTSPEYVASYEGAAPALPADYLVLASTDTANVFHVFHMVANQRA